MIRGLVCVLPFITLLFTGTQAHGQARLERVVLVARHGLRSPTATPAALDAMTGRHWPVWPVAPGELTPRGRTALAAMSDAIAERYRRLGVLRLHTCGTVLVWADVADDRTRDSGAIMARHLSPDCDAKAMSLAPGQVDALFNGLKHGNAILNRTVIAQALSVDPQAASEPVRAAWARMQNLMVPDGCTTKHVCFTTSESITWKHNQPKLSGGASLAAMVSENLLLAWAEGLEITWAPDNGPSLLKEVMPAHDYISRLTRRLPAIAQPRGAKLARTIDDLLHDRTLTLPNRKAVDPSMRMIVFAGHDTTLDMLAGIYGLTWSFVDQPDPTAPDTTMAFERWRMADGHHVFRIVMLHQSLEALRTGKAPDLLRSKSITEWQTFPCVPQPSRHDPQKHPPK